MNKIVFAVILSATQLLMGQITNSYNTSRHQVAILISITHQCGILHRVTQLSQKQQVVRVDNGVRDVKFITVLRGVISDDQHELHEYDFLVHTTFHDSFDHNTNQWGRYTVESVKCERVR